MGRGGHSNYGHCGASSSAWNFIEAYLGAVVIAGIAIIIINIWKW